MNWLNSLTMDRWIALASSFGTLIAAIFAAFSIRELRLQRAQQFKPRIAPANAGYKLSVHPKNLLNLKGQNEQTIPLINVGHGVATDLTVKWRVPIDLWIEKINSISAQQGGEVGVIRSPFGIELRYKGQVTGGARIPEDQSYSVPYLVPVTTDRNPAQIPIPCAITSLINSYYWSYFKGAGNNKNVFRNPSPEFSVDVILNYKDTLGRVFTRHSVLMFSVLLESEPTHGDERPLEICVAVQPVRTEPAEGYSIITQLFLKLIKDGVTLSIGRV